ncbi:alpha/beta fold hydrolase [Saccharopolyspora erythraea]|uniref:thioesterase domain-containing protein n=1 Tax=Saccharopolyspora erythraea TaxID=1836 RepID=UPI001BAC126F|nr:alpha/beta fold hydrolase [Saccharopolyspora erythraea]QUG99412.1 alpha/beta fold hydrolase [Saccharopolyspora erythraea]
MRGDEPLVRELVAGSGTGHRVVLVHPGALPLSCYRPIAAELSGDTSLHVVDLEKVPEYFEAALTDHDTGLSLDGMAERVHRELAACDLLGDDVVLGGWSFGGVVGYAVAARSAPRQRPRRLLVADSIAPVAEFTTTTDDEIGPELLLPWFAMYLGAKRGVAIDLDAGDVRGMDVEAGLERALTAVLDAGALPPDTSVAGLRGVYRAYSRGLLRNDRVARDYAAKPVDVPITLVRPRSGLLGGSRPLGWDQLAAAGLSTLDCPGDHYSMLSDPDAVAVIADAARERNGSRAPVPSRTTGRQPS